MKTVKQIKRQINEINPPDNEWELGYKCALEWVIDNRNRKYGR